MAELSNVTKEGILVSEQDWEKYVSGLKEKTKKTFSKEEAKQLLKARLIDAVKKRVPKEKFGLFLSGGVDSSLIAFILRKKLKEDFVCYGVGMEGSRDVQQAQKLAELIGLDLRTRSFSLEESEGVIKEAAGIVGVPDVVNIGVGSVEVAAASLGSEDGVKVFFSGLGSEEIFAGYQRHAEAEDVNQECWRGMKKMHGRDLVRDSKICSAMKISFLTPYLDPELIETAMSVPGEYKINREEKKIILRETALELGLSEDFAFRKKIAAQYGSGFDKAIGILARKKGFKYKKEYLASLF